MIWPFPLNFPEFHERLQKAIRLIYQEKTMAVFDVIVFYVQMLLKLSQRNISDKCQFNNELWIRVQTLGDFLTEWITTKNNITTFFSNKALPL